MCGILGYIRIDGAPLPDTLGPALSSIAHRGPDNEQTLIEEGVFLGHRRLKILDLGELANQPMTSSDGRYTLIYNGEIYNYIELRADLESRGYSFQTTGDTEVLLYLYAEFGHACVDHLNGMFAFVVYDRVSREVFAARDRLGIKPIYYAWDHRTLIISSEIRAIVAADPSLGEIDQAALAQYLMLGSVQAPRTIFKRIKALLPGHSLALTEGSLRKHEYWSAPFIPESEKARVTFEEASGRTRELLTDSVQKQLISDVALGAFLSGGIDSTIIAGLMSASNGVPPKTFSIRYDEGGSAYNEGPIAAQTATHFECDHHECLVSGDDVFAELPRFIQHLDQPSCDGLNVYFVSKFAREHVTVALSGLGGDEIFVGYPKARQLDLLRRLGRNFPKLPRSAIAKLEALLGDLPVSFPKRKHLQALSSVAGAWPANADLYLLLQSYFSREFTVRLLDLPDTSFLDDAITGLHSGDTLHPLDASCYFDLRIFMGNRLLRDADVMSMAHSLELRVPFLDHRLVEYVAQLPVDLKYSPGKTKPLLTHAFRDVLPPHVLNLKKLGFSVPTSYWIQGHRFRQRMLDGLSDSGLLRRGIFDRQALQRVTDSCLKADTRKPHSFEGSLLYLLTILELWLEWMDGQPSRQILGQYTHAVPHPGRKRTSGAGAHS